MFGFFKKKAVKESASQEAVTENHDSTTTEPERPAQSQYIADQPISGKAQDRFNRAKFATRIAETIATRLDPTSIVIGLYGPWGDGKTSVLEMMHEELATYSHVIVIRFNPWHFQNEDLLLRGFFATLADAMGNSLPNTKEKAGDLLKKYGSVLSLASLTLSGVVQVSPGDAAKGIGEAMSNVGLDELRNRIERMLAEAKKRIVVLIDDIDRLDRKDTHALFKLVKLSAGFRYTSYVLAFDDSVVSSALGERYGAGGESAGRAFLEKIIQVPLHLPPADQNILRQIALEGVQSALNQAEIKLTQSQIDAFIRHFDDALLPQLETPRRAKLFSNALLFALPILKDEVNPVDLMLIEGIRIIYPQLYTAIRENPELFLDGDREQRRNGPRDPVRRIDSLIERSTPTLIADERESLKARLLAPLFPRIGNSIYGGEWDQTWGVEQKISSKQYFKRFFTYSVPFGDVPDAHVDSLCLVATSSSSRSEMRALLEAFAARQGLPRVVARLRQKANSLSQTQASGLISALAMSGDIFPRERGMIAADTRARAGMLVADLLRQVPDGAVRQAEAEQTMRVATPVSFAMECFRWIRHDESSPPEKRVLTGDGDAALRVILTDRIEESDAASPLFIAHPKDANSLYWLWMDGTSMTHVSQRLEALFVETPEHVDRFLACFVGEAWGLESGLPRPADFDRRKYDSVSQIIAPAILAANLRLRYGSELDSPESDPPDTMDHSRRVAHQFIAMHQQATQGSCPNSALAEEDHSDGGH